MSDAGLYVIYVCDACVPKVPGADWIRERAADQRDAEHNHFMHPTPFRCVACGWIE